MYPLVSVILPTYNRAHMLPFSIRSVLDQSFSDLELIVVDDASSEDIEAVVGAFNDDRVRYVRLDENAGAAAARNVGLSKVRGKYIAFQDSDDLWLPGKLTRQVELLEQQPDEVGAVTGLKVLYGRDITMQYGPGRCCCAPDPSKRVSLEDDQLKHSILNNRISLQNTLFRHNCLPQEDWFDPLARANNDWEFVVRLVQHTKVLEVIEPFVFAMISTDSISTNPRKRITGQLRIFKKNRAVMETYPKEYGQFVYALGCALYKCGRKNIARRLLLLSFRLYPNNLLHIASRGISKLLRFG